MHHALVMIWLFVLLKPFSNGVGVGGTTAPKATQGDFLGVLVDRSGFRDGPVIGAKETDFAKPGTLTISRQRPGSTPVNVNAPSLSSWARGCGTKKGPSIGASEIWPFSSGG